MSMLTVTDIRRTGEVASRSTRGVAIAWMNLNCVTPVIRDGLNISSIIDNGTGDFTHNFTASAANGNYTIPRAGDFDSTVNASAVTTLEVLSALASSCRLWVGAGATPFDALRLESAMHGSLA